MADKRIYELTEASTVGSSDVLALDSQNMAATKKVKVKTITDPLSNKNDISSLILTGSTNTTGGTIEAGRYFYLDGDLVIAKTNIAAGATFTPGTNYVSATVGGELTDVKQTLTDFLVIITYNFKNENIDPKQTNEAAFEAGTIGTRGVRCTWDISSEMNSGLTPISVYLRDAFQPSLYVSHPMIDTTNKLIKLDIFRATSNACANARTQINVVYAKSNYMVNK